MIYGIQLTREMDYRRENIYLVRTEKVLARLSSVVEMTIIGKFRKIMFPVWPSLRREPQSNAHGEA